MVESEWMALLMSLLLAVGVSKGLLLEMLGVGDMVMMLLRFFYVLSIS